VFVDTPGYQTRHQNALNRVMNRTVGQVASEVDAIVFVIDAAGWDERDAPVLALPAQGRAGDPRPQQGRSHARQGPARRDPRRVREAPSVRGAGAGERHQGHAAEGAA
jgi:hypothetical protein